MDVSALGRPNDLRHLDRRPRIRNQLGLVPAPKLGSVGADYWDDATSSRAHLCGWLLLNRTTSPGLQENLNSAGLTALSVMSAISCPLLLFLMWSPRGEMVFSPEYLEIVRRTTGSRPGCLGILPALAVVQLAELASYMVVMMTVLSILAMLEMIRSI